MIEKAWVQFIPGSPPVVNAGKNLASDGTGVVRTAAGDYLINLKDDLPNGQAIVHGALGGMTIAAAQRRHIAVQVVSVRQLRVTTQRLGVLEDAAELSVFVETDNDGSIGA